MVNAGNVEDDELLSRLSLISKESTMSADNVGNTPSKVHTYYGGVSAGVPFLWESKPGTPKHSSSSVNTTSSSLFPPLNPPPCYNTGNAAQSPMKIRSKSSSFRSLFSRKLPNFINRKKSRFSDHVPEEASSTSSSSSSSSAPSSPRPLTAFRRSRSTSVGHKSMFDCEFYDDEKTSMSRGSSAYPTRCFWR